MRPITEYQDYRAYIADYYAYKKRTSAFTWREFAKLAGFGSPVYLKQVAEGKFNLSESAVARVAAAMNLVGYEADYFGAMVAYAHAKTESARHENFAKMVAIAEENKVEVVGAESFKFFDSYKNVLLRELAPAMPNARPMDMAKACRPELSAAEVSNTLKFLVKSGFLTKDKNGNYRQSSKSVKMAPILQKKPHDCVILNEVCHSGALERRDGAIESGEVEESRPELKPLAATELQRQMGELALKALDLPRSERNMTGLTLGMSKKCYAEVVKELAECRRRIVALVQSDSVVEKVYRLNMQLFPMTERLDDVTFKVAEQGRSDLSERTSSPRLPSSSPLSFWRGDAVLERSDRIESRESPSSLNKKHPSPKRRKK